MCKASYKANDTNSSTTCIKHLINKSIKIYKCINWHANSIKEYQIIDKPLKLIKHATSTNNDCLPKKPASKLKLWQSVDWAISLYNHT